MQDEATAVLVELHCERFGQQQCENAAERAVAVVGMAVIMRSAGDAPPRPKLIRLTSLGVFGERSITTTRGTPSAATSP